ncbi:MAG: hypothetical protein ACOY32_15830 [Thermodesulfobacteriota bacterium]
MKLFNSFAATISSPFFWWLKAWDLYQAALSLMQSYKEASEIYFEAMPKKTGRVKLTPQQQEASTRLGFPQVYLFLMGLAFENALKGLLISRDPSLVEDSKLSEKISKGSKGHYLLDLFDKAEIRLSSEEQEFINRLSDSVIWAGRYPAPKHEKDWVPTSLLQGGHIQPGTYMPSDEATAQTIWRRTEEVLRKDPNYPKAI